MTAPDLVERLVDKHVTGSDAFKADALRFATIVAEAVSEAAHTEITTLRAELAGARADALEEAAMVADQVAARRFTKDMREMAKLIAATIRALKDKPDAV